MIDSDIPRYALSVKIPHSRRSSTPSMYIEDHSQFAAENAANCQASIVLPCENRTSLVDSRLDRNPPSETLQGASFSRLVPHNLSFVPATAILRNNPGSNVNASVDIHQANGRSPVGEGSTAEWIPSFDI